LFARFISFLFMGFEVEGDLNETLDEARAWGWIWGLRLYGGSAITTNAGLFHE
jgi:hypothetical protein